MEKIIAETGTSRRRFLLASAGVAAATAAGGLASAISSAGSARAAGANLLALVHTQAAGDNGPVDGMIAAIKKLAEEQGMAHRAIYAADAATYETILRSLGTAGANAVVTTFNEMAEPIKAVAPAYPETKFIQLYADPFEPVIPNVVTVAYDYYLGCYLSGMFGARFTASNKLGFIGGVSIPGINADFNAFKAGAESINPKIEVTSAFAGSFQDPAKGREIASQMYQTGIDYIQTDSAATDTGIIQVANEGPARFVSALDKQQYKLGPKTVMSIVQLDFGLSLYTETGKALAADWQGGGHVNTDLSSGVVEFMLSDTFLKEGPADMIAKAQTIWPDIENAKKAIIGGTLKVPFNTTL